MGNLQKITKAQIKAVCAEIERVKDDYGNYKQFNHEVHEIDYTRTHLNQNYTINHTKRGYEYIEKRLEELKVFNRDDVKVIGSWVWQAPQDLPQEYHRAFFKEIVGFYANKHGYENIGYACVHNDERTPHIHIGIIPVSKNKKGVDRVCAKEVFTKQYLQSAHADLEEHLTQRLGIRINLLTGNTLGVDGIKNYKKAKDLAQSVEELSQDTQELQKDIARLQQEQMALNASIQAQREQIEEYEEEIKKKGEEVVGLDRDIEERKNWLVSFREKVGKHSNFFKAITNWLNKALHLNLNDGDIDTLEKAHTRDMQRLEVSAPPKKDISQPRRRGRGGMSL